MKKVLFLGAAKFQTPPIQYACNKGYLAITCDNIPANPGHALAYKAYNVSTLDTEKVLHVAKKEKVDGILTFASDVSAATAAYVAQELNLPGNSRESIETLTNKGKFKKFLQRTGIQCSISRIFSLSEKDEMRDYINSSKLPLVIKPTDSSGSKGVSIINSMNQLSDASVRAFESSRCKQIVIEPFIAKYGHQVCGDGFVQNGKIVMLEFGDGHFYDNNDFLAPYGETFPCSQSENHLEAARQKIGEILEGVGFRQGPFNVDLLITREGSPYVIEIGPRNGGNFIPRIIELNTNVNMTAASVEIALNQDYRFICRQTRSKYFHAGYMVHSLRAGILKDVQFSRQIRNNILEWHAYLSRGEKVQAFQRANAAVGNLILRFKSLDEMHEKMRKMNEYCKVRLDDTNDKEINSNIKSALNSSKNCIVRKTTMVDCQYRKRSEAD